MALFDGLFLYEIILLALGIVLFCAAIFAILYQVLHKQNLGAVLPGLILLSIAMIAYPSIHAVQYKDGLFSIEKETRAVQTSPGDSGARKQLQQSVSQVSQRVGTAAKDPGSVALIASAQYALGNDTAAKVGLQKALTLDPQAPKALALKERIETAERISRLNTLPQTPANNAELKKTVAGASKLEFANPGALMNLAVAQSSLGDHRLAIENLDKVISIKPDLTSAQQLRSELLSKPVK